MLPLKLLALVVCFSATIRDMTLFDVSTSREGRPLEDFEMVGSDTECIPRTCHDILQNSVMPSGI
jgi:hypothetical protein